MPFLELVCKKCGHKFEELAALGERPRCPVCGGETEQNYSGGIWVNSVKSGGGCTGNCSTCGGCHK